MHEKPGFRFHLAAVQPSSPVGFRLVGGSVMFSVSCERSLYGGRKAAQLFVVGLTAATLAACAQSSVVTNRSASLATSRQVSLGPNRAASFVTNKRTRLLQKGILHLPPTNMRPGHRMRCMDSPASTWRGQRRRAAKSWTGTN